MTCKTCNAPLEYSGRGRPPTYCPDHAKTARKATWSARPKGGHPERLNVPQCCSDARTAGVERYGVERDVKVWQRNPAKYADSEWICTVVTVHGAHVRPANVKKCAQHKEMSIPLRPIRAWDEPRQRTDIESEIAAIGGFRIGARASITFMVPEARLRIVADSGTKYGVDPVLEREANRLLAISL